MKLNKLVFSFVAYAQVIFLSLPLPSIGVDWFAYICNTGIQTQSYIDLQSFPLTAQNLNQSGAFQVFPRRVQVAPDAKTTYMTNFDNNILVIDVASQTITGEIPMPTPSGGSQPALGAISITEDGNTILVADTNNNVVFPYNIPTNTVGTPYPTGPNPQSIAITPNGQPLFAFVTCTDNTVTAIDLTNNTVSTISSPLLNEPLGIGMLPDGSAALVVNHGTTTIAAIDTATHAVSIFADTVTGMNNDYISIAGNGQFACITDVDGFVIKLDIATRVSTFVSSNGSNPLAVDITPDNKMALVTNTNSFTVVPIDMTTDPPTPGTPIPLPANSLPEGIGITPDQAPTALFTSSAMSNGSTDFDASASSTPTGTIVTYAWNFGDGTTTTTSSPTIHHQYTVPGTYVVTLTVTNSAGTSTLKTYNGKTVVNNGGPSATTSQSLTFNLLPPANLQGKQVKNRFLNISELVNVLTWNMPMDSMPIQGYHIYRDSLQNLIGTVLQTAQKRFQFEDHHINEDQTYTYFVVSFDRFGDVSVPATVVVFPRD